MVGNSPKFRLYSNNGYMQLSEYDMQIVDGSLWWYRYDVIIKDLYDNDWDMLLDGFTFKFKKDDK
jgi:hypothetical protein